MALINAAKHFEELYQGYFTAMQGMAESAAAGAPDAELVAQILDYHRIAPRPDFGHMQTLAMEAAHYKVNAARNLLNRRSMQRRRGKPESMHELPPSSKRPTLAQVLEHMAHQKQAEPQVIDYAGPLPEDPGSAAVADGLPPLHSYDPDTEVEIDREGVASPEDLADGGLL